MLFKINRTRYGGYIVHLGVMIMFVGFIGKAFDKEANILKGKRTGRTFRIGQKINVQLANVIPEERKIVLVPK